MTLLEFPIRRYQFTLVAFLCLVALGWFGTWMGMTHRKTSLAVVKTIAFVLVLPWLALMFVQGIVIILTPACKD